ncbi:MAG: hypothetical protein Q9N34_09010 [Aquificota bacterium]|nr:hypothetical protein [Aquificota bacterium]
MEKKRQEVGEIRRERVKQEVSAVNIWKLLEGIKKAIKEGDKALCKLRGFLMDHKDEILQNMDNEKQKKIIEEAIEYIKVINSVHTVGEESISINLGENEERKLHFFIYEVCLAD